MSEEEFWEAFGFEQAQTMALHFILYEVVRTLARQSMDPKKYLSDMFDRVCSRSDQTAKASEKPPTGQARDTIDSFFSSLARHV